MSSEIQKDLNEILNKVFQSISNKKTAIFCGAGISFNSGLPLANDILQNILTKIGLNRPESDLILNSALPFESIMEVLKTETEIDEILDIFSFGECNTNHILLAFLAKKGLINTVLTTNFDLLIEKAFLESGLRNNIDFEVFSSEEDFQKINWESNRIRLIKIHGCISNKKEIAITMQSVANKTYSTNRNRIIEGFFSKALHEKVLILGYSCSDLFDISPQIESINESKSEVYFIEHLIETLEGNSQAKVENISNRETKNPFKFFKDSYRLIINTNKFIELLWKSSLDENYKFIKSTNSAWLTNIDLWLNRSIKEYTIGMKHQISGKLFYNIGEYEQAIVQYRKGVTIAYENKNPQAYCSELGNLGMALNALSRYDEAKDCLEKSIQLCRIAEHKQGEASQLQALGNVYRNLGDFNSAKLVLQEAINLSELYNENASLGTSLGNLALVYNATEEFDEAIKCLKRGLEISYEMGNKQAEGSQLCSIGTAYFQKGDIESGKKYITKSIEITRSINDKQGECMALINLSNVYMMSNDFNISLIHAKSSLAIARSIGIRESEGGSYYVIGTCYLYTGEIKLAIKNFEFALDIYTKIFNDGHYRIETVKKALLIAKIIFNDSSIY